MQEEKKKPVFLAEHLAEYIARKDYGTVVRYQEIEEIIGESRGKPRYNNVIQKTRKLLLERGKAMKSIGGHDYQVMTPGDYTKEAARQTRLANNAVRKGVKILDNTPVQDMNVTERAEHNMLRDFYTGFLAKTEAGLKEVQILVKQRPNPLEACYRRGND